jgi:phosphodiesterase/alkaline phosphatase D-like protein
MNKRLFELVFIAAIGCLLSSNAMLAQPTPTTPKTARGQVTEGPALESSKDNWAIITWTSNNPGGTEEHFGVVHYGTDPNSLTQTAKSHIRLNPSHSYTVFRVRLDDLKPGTTYYYTVGSMGSNGADDGTKSTVKQFTTTGEPERAGRQ